MKPPPDGQQTRRERVEAALRECGSVVVAFSGGVDSALVLAVARQVLGDNVLAVGNPCRVVRRAVSTP